jgi:hypothetical protein
MALIELPRTGKEGEKAANYRIISLGEMKNGTFSSPAFKGALRQTAP